MVKNLNAKHKKGKLTFLKGKIGGGETWSEEVCETKNSEKANNLVKGKQMKNESHIFQFTVYIG